MSVLLNPLPATFPAVDIPIPTNTAQNAMRKALKEYLLELTFQRPEGERFKLRRKDVHTEWPDPEKKMNYPSVAIVGGIGLHESLGGFNPTVAEETFNEFGYGTALVQIAEYVEEIQLSLWGADKGARRALLACVINALTPGEFKYGLDLATTNYFDRVASFQLIREQLIDGEETVRNVRRADLYIEGRIPVVQLRPFNTIRPQIEVEIEEVTSQAVLDSG